MLPADLETLIGELQMEFQQLSSEVITRQIQRAAIRFCKLSNYWHMLINPVMIESGVTAYSLSAGRHYKVLDVLKVKRGDEVIRLYGNADERTYQQTGAGEVSLYGFTAGEFVDIEVSVAPNLIDGEIWLLPSIEQDFGDAILDGARAAIFKMPKEWANLNLHQLHEQYFNQACAAARLKQANNYATASLQERSYVPQRFY